MNVKKHAMAGTLESSDIFLEIYPNSGKIEIELQSIVLRQYGDDIKRIIAETLTSNGVTGALVKANDRGALGCVIRARVETVLARAGKECGQ